LSLFSGASLVSLFYERLLALALAYAGEGGFRDL
jgi:hypothetical protein